MPNNDTDFIILDENPVYANQISEFIQCLNLSCLRFQRPQLYGWLQRELSEKVLSSLPCNVAVVDLRCCRSGFLRFSKLRSVTVPLSGMYRIIKANGRDYR
jgi:hypothetical protein